MSLSKKKAFIAAPLLGTIIFLASVAFVINLSKIEAADSARIIADAYHNRLVSLLELYRSDLASLFRGSLSSSIENLLTKQNWQNLFKIKNHFSDTEDAECTPDYTSCAGYDQQYGGDADTVSLSDSRYFACKHTSKVISAIICAIPSDCAEQCELDNNDPPDCEGDVNTEDTEAYCCEQCEKGAYGLPKWMENLNEEYSFEGTTFMPANEAQFSKFTTYSNDYSKLCQALLAGSIFDCDAFAEDTPVLQCKDGDVIPGCENGNFFVKISLENSEVYPYLPRVSVSDGMSNQIRSGSIGDEDFYLPIAYPLFYYYNQAFAFYEIAAYGQNGAANGYKDEGDIEGVADGFCAGGNGQDKCDDKTAFLEFGGDKGTASIASDDVSAAKIFFNTFKVACEKGNAPSEVELQFCTDSSKCGIPGEEQGGWKNCADYQSDSSVEATGDLYTGITEQIDTPNVAGSVIPYYPDVNWNLRFKDYRPAYRINEEYENVFAWWAAPQHDCPSGETGVCTS